MARAGKDEMRRGTEPPASALSRRGFIKLGGAAALASGMPLAPLARAAEHPGSEPRAAPPSAGAADYTIRIGTGLVELGPDTTISTKTYNRRFPGPLLRLTEGKRVVVDVHNDTDTPEQLHWHGQFVPVDVDGAAEEGTPFIPAYGMRRIAFTPGPAGLRFYHTHLAAGPDLSLGLYNGQAGPVYIEPRREPGAYDREVFLTLKEFGPFLSRTEMPSDFLAPTTEIAELREAAQQAMLAALKKGRQAGLRARVQLLLDQWPHARPRRADPGQDRRARAVPCAERQRQRNPQPGACPGMSSRSRRSTATRCRTRRRCRCCGSARPSAISAVVEMQQPGIWVMGDLIDEDRGRGMGIVVEYADRHGRTAMEEAGALPLGLSALRPPDARGSRAARRDRSTMTFAARHRSARRVRRVHDQRHRRSRWRRWSRCSA